MVAIFVPSAVRFGRMASMAIIVGASVAHASTTSLSLAEAEQLAISRQPLVDAQEAAIRSARARAIADRQLPDPKLFGGLQDLPINGDPAFTLDRDDFTMVKAGIKQEFPRAEKRRLRGERSELEARARMLELATVRRQLRRDAALAWVDVYRSERSLVPMQALIDEYDNLVRAAAIALQSSVARQSELLAARMESGAALDRRRALQGDVQRSRVALARFIGADADRPLPDAVPRIDDPPPLDDLLMALRTHPHLDRYAAQVRVAENDVALSRAEYGPDWAIALEYGYRREFPDFVGVEFEMDLPFFHGQRQDRRLEASLASVDELRAEHAAVWREHEAELRGAYSDWEATRDRIETLERVTLPAARQRADAVRASYESTRASLAEMLAARRDVHEVELKVLALETEHLRARIQLQFFEP
jgi:outer membrane protein TolC